MQLIARRGDLLEVAPGDFRTISGLNLVNGFSLDSGTGNSDGRPSGFNNLGQLAFQASFTDGSSGIFVSNLVAVPEPDAAASMLGSSGRRVAPQDERLSPGAPLLAAMLLGIFRTC